MVAYALIIIHQMQLKPALFEQVNFWKSEIDLGWQHICCPSPSVRCFYPS